MPNAQILARAKIITVLEMVKIKRLRWLGHVARQADARLPKRLMHRRFPSKASRGRPPKCWTDYVREDLEAPKLLHNWARLAQDRDSWRDRIHKLMDVLLGFADLAVLAPLPYSKPDMLPASESRVELLGCRCCSALRVLCQVIDRGTKLPHIQAY